MKELKGISCLAGPPSAGTADPTPPDESHITGAISPLVGAFLLAKIVANLLSVM
jgi:hypothetical protein